MTYMRTLLVTVMMLGACLFLPGCMEEKEQVICEGEEPLEENWWYECSFEMLEDGTITIEVELTGDTPVTILTIPASEYENWYYCEEFDYYEAGSKVDSMSTTLEFDYQTQENWADELYVIFWNSDWPNSCDEEENGPTVNGNFKITVS